ncbi:MAG: hypothetical protein LBH43_11160 [Treponema sp.]|jgi:hypothetical protein|nr:hypothetical protein [Treponema sp.]
MNQDTVKKNLLKIHACTEDFTVIFSGKKCQKVNGLYKPDKKEIIIHNRNFNNDEAGENLLFYTAIHEQAHHIMFTELKKKSARSHTALFWATLDDLADIAEKKGLYKIAIDTDTEKLINEAHEISCEIAMLQKKLGQTLARLNEKCREKGIRFEDIVERKAQIAKKTADKANKAYTMNLPGSIGVDIQEAVLRERDEDVREVMINAGQKGKSVEQVKRTKTGPVDHEDETVSLMKEKTRLERTIESLKRRLYEVEEQLTTKGEL